MSKLNIGQNAGYTKSKNDSMPENYPNTIVEAVYWDDKKKLLSEVLSDSASKTEELEDKKLNAPATAGSAGQVLSLDANGKSAWVDAATGGTYDGALSDSSTNAPQNKVVTAKLSELGHEVGRFKDMVLPIGVDGNEILTKDKYIVENKFIDGFNALILDHTGWNMYIIPVEVGVKYGYRSVNAGSGSYAFFLLNDNLIAVGAYGANNSAPDIQAIGGQPYPADNAYGYKIFQIPSGVAYVAFNKDINSVGYPLFFKGDTKPSLISYVNAINDKELEAANGLSDNDIALLDALLDNATLANEAAYKWATSPAANSGVSGSAGMYFAFISPDTGHAGFLDKFIFTGAATAAYTFKFKVFKKIYSEDDDLSLQEIMEDIMSVSQGDTEIDFLPKKIWMEKDYLLAFIMDSSVKNPMKYRSDNDTGYEWLNCDTMAYPLSYKIRTDFNYTIAYYQFSIPDNLSKANVVCLGDSITWLGGDDCMGMQNPSRGWTTYFKNMVSPKSIVSYARSGATWSHTANTQYDITENTGSLSDDNVIYNQINRLLAAVSGGTQATPDIIIIAAGTNDAWYPASRPDALSVDADTEFADTSGYITSQAVGTLTSIAAAMRYDIELLKTNFPNCQVFVTTPLQSKAFTLAKCFNVGQLIKDCAKYLSVECIDQAAEAGIYRAQENVGYLFTYDGTHTSALGAKMVGQFLAKKVLAEYRGKLA